VPVVLPLAFLLRIFKTDVPLCPFNLSFIHILRGFRQRINRGILKDGRERPWGQSILKIALTTKGWEKGGVNSGVSEKGNAGNYAKGGHLEGTNGVLPVLGQ
jgi:hypothetical protein